MHACICVFGHKNCKAKRATYGVFVCVKRKCNLFLKAAVYLRTHYKECLIIRHIETFFEAPPNLILDLIPRAPPCSAPLRSTSGQWKVRAKVVVHMYGGKVVSGMIPLYISFTLVSSFDLVYYCIPLT